MASEGPNNPGTSGNDATVGDYNWTTSTSRIQSSNNYYAYTPVLGYDLGYFKEYSIKIIKAGTISGNEKSGNSKLPLSDNYVTYGGTGDLWGVAWSASDINASNFGVGFSVAEEVGGERMRYLTATNFGFSIPDGATINGIKVEIEQRTDEDTSEISAYVDHIRITVYYTEVPVGTNTQINIGDVWKEIPEMKINIGDTWKDVASMQINIGDVWKEIF